VAFFVIMKLIQVRKIKLTDSFDLFNCWKLHPLSLAETSDPVFTVNVSQEWSYVNFTRDSGDELFARAVSR